jgi:hypothetical protein
MINYVRWILSAALLFVVWRHAHWSVAASLTLLALSVELQAVLWRTVAGKAGKFDTR